MGQDGKTVCGATDAEGNQLLLAGYAGRPNGDGGAAAVVVVAQREMDGAKTNYTTNAIESLTAQLRKVIENWSHSRPTRRQQAALAGHPHVETSTPPPGPTNTACPSTPPAHQTSWQARPNTAARFRCVGFIETAAWGHWSDDDPQLRQLGVADPHRSLADTLFTPLRPATMTALATAQDRSQVTTTAHSTTKISMRGGRP